MQFSVVSVIALAAAASANFVPRQYNVTVPYPTGTGTGIPSGPVPTSTIPFTGAAPAATGFAGSVGALALAGGVALFI